MLVGLIFFGVIAIPIFLYPEPNLAPPDVNPPLEMQDVEEEEEIQVEPQNENGGSRPDPPSNPQLPNLIPLFVGIALIVVVIGLITLVKRKGVSTGLRNLNEIEKTKVSKLKFSRDQARQILINAKETGNYTDGIINAYLSLDSALDNFREVARPKHWTPKEYAFTVREPVFQPSVYKIIEIFYSIRYGLNKGTSEQIDTFLQYLDKMLIEELTSQQRETELQEFEQTKESYQRIRVPLRGDLTKP